MTEKLARISIEKGELSIKISQLEIKCEETLSELASLKETSSATAMELEMTKREGERDVQILQENI